MWFSLSIQHCVRSFLICHLFGLHGLTETAVSVMCNSLFLCTYWTKMSVWNDAIFTCETFHKFLSTNCFYCCFSLNCKYFKKQGEKKGRRKKNSESICHVNSKVHFLRQCSNTWLFSLKLAEVMEDWKPVCVSSNVGYTCRINISTVIV